MPSLPPEWVALGASSPDEESKPVVAPPPAEPANTVALKRLAGLAHHLATTPKGGRHQALYTIARTLGGLVASRHLTTTRISDSLLVAAGLNGLI